MELAHARIGLALSGGGFRATLFHLGVVKLLHETGALTGVKRIGAVSGGSILAAHLVLNWDQYTGTGAQFNAVAQHLIRFVQKDIRGRVVRRWILACVTLLPRLALSRGRRWTFTNLLSHYYAGLFRDASLKQLRGAGHPEVTFNCTSLTTGSPCFFDQSGFRWYENDKEESVTAPETKIAFAVAASSAFPPLFPPIEISNETLVCDQSRFRNSYYLSDGGVYDNLGIDRLLRQQAQSQDLDLLVASDAEGNFDSEFDTSYTFLVSRNVRASDLLMTRVSSLQFKSFLSQKPGFVRVGIKDELLDLDDPTLLSPEAQRSLSKVRTDLDAFSSTEVTALIAHGYSKARHELIERGWLSDDAPKFSWDPLKNWSSLQSGKATDALKGSSIRKWRLWSYRDLASWATVVFIGFLVSVALAIPAFIVSVQSGNDLRAAADAQVKAEANLQRTAVVLDDLLLSLNRLNVPASAEWKSGWQLLRLGSDCPGNDIADSPGAQPDNEMCSNDRITAVCWDGTRFLNASKYNGRPWCTYKRLRPENCIGGTAPGRLYGCVPKEQHKPISITTYRLCIGEYPEQCPPDAVHLYCGALVTEWAKSRCSSFTQTALSSRSGNKCGYSVVQVACVSQADSP